MHSQVSFRSGRLIELSVGEPAENMALDQAMLESVDEGGPPTLRLYQWSEPTLSIGYFQPIADRVKHVESRSAVCVRRASGGGAILHHHELTYSIAWPIDGQPAGANLKLYHDTHKAIADTIGNFGVRAARFSETASNRVYREQASRITGVDPFLCFQRRFDDDLIVNGYKVVGSAQRKGKRAVLQHGSLLVRASELAPQLPGLWELGASSYAVAEIAQAIVMNLSETLKVRWRAASWTGEETDRAIHLASERFDTPSWLHRK